MIALDTETCLIMPGILAPPLVCVSFSRRERGELTRDLMHRLDRDRVVGQVSESFQEHTTWANAPYDLAVFLAYDGRLLAPIMDALEAGRVHDVQMRQKLMDLADGQFRFEEDEETGETKVVYYSLGDLGRRHKVGRKEYDNWRLRYHELYETPLSEWPEEAIYYAIHDADLTLLVHEKQEETASGEARNNLLDEKRHVCAHMALHLASCRGLRTDPDAVKALRERTVDELAALLPDLVEAGLARRDGTRSTKEAIRRMIGTGQIHVTQTGAEILQGVPERWQKLPSTPKVSAFKAAPCRETFLAMAHEEGRWISVSRDACIESGDDVLMKYSRYSQARNLLSGSVKDLEKGVLLPIQSRFDPLKETGRTGSSKPNIQNLRRVPGVRECYIPRPGFLFVAADYSAAELHTLAQSCLDLLGHSALAEALNQGIDPHAWVGSLILGIPYEEMVKRLGQDDLEAKDARQLAKVANFGYPGGCSATTFSAIARGQGVEIDAHQSAQLRGIWFRSWPEMKEFFNLVGDSTDGSWYWAKLTRSGRLRSRCTFTAACNTYFQGPAADGAKSALWEVARESLTDAESPLAGSYLVNFVHDELLLESPEEKAPEAAERLAVVMADAFNRTVPDVPTKAEPTVMRYWSKKAKTLRDENGRIRPWPE